MKPEADLLVEEYLQAGKEERERIGRIVRNLPHRRIKIIYGFGFLVLLSLVILIDLFFIYGDLPPLTRRLEAGVILSLLGLCALTRMWFFYQSSRPSVYRLLAEYKARQGSLPPEQ